MSSNDGASIRTWTPGSTVATYELIREIARGGMGEIWLARQRGPADFQRLVVLKRIIASRDEDASFVDMFLDEARIVSHLQHPNIVQMFELGEDTGSYFLALEYLAGQNLSRVARRMVEVEGRVPVSFAVEAVIAAARGLGYAHRRKGPDGAALNIVHRDVSPQNLFVTYDGLVKVLDFGVAKAAGRRVRTETGMVKGKLVYMSPEQALGLPLDASADVFALGIVLFELVTGARLYGDDEEVKVLRRLADAAPLPRARDLAPQLDARLDELISTALKWNHLSRFADGAVMAEALDGWLRQHGESPAPTAAERMQRLFSQEISSLPATLRVTAQTPTNDSVRSLPDNRSLLSTAPDRPPRGRPVASALGLGAAVLVLSSGAAFWLMGRPPPAAPAVDAEREVAAPAEPEAAAELDAGPPVASAASVVRDERPTPRAPATARKGMLTLETDPWAIVYLGKRKLGETPLIKVPLPAGVHRLRLINEPEHLDAYIEVDVVADVVTVKHMVF